MTVTTEITDSLLLALAGEAAFQRGVGYFENGNVLNWRKKGTTIRAEVAGSATYLVTLEHSVDYLEGCCDCPASEGIGFCKHCVAVAMVYRREMGEQQALAGGAVEQRLEAYLKSMDAEQLTEELLQLILDDVELTQQWSLKADLASGKVNAKSLRKRIIAALPYKRYLHRYQQVRDYFATAEPTIDLLTNQAAHLPADTALQLADYGIERLARALETVDDSGGYRFTIEDQLQTLHHELIGRLDWAPQKLADYLYNLAMGGSSDFYPPIPGAYSDVLDGQVLECYYRKLQSEWDKLPVLAENSSWEDKYSYLRLQDPLLAQARDRGDFPAQVALLRKTAISEHDLLSLCRLCIDNKAWEQAEFWLKKARRITDRDHYHHESDRLQIRLHLQKNELSKALDLQWTIFTKTLIIRDYQQLLDLAQGGSHQVDYSMQARAWLRSQLGAPDNRGFSSNYTRALMALYLHEDDMESALHLSEQGDVAAEQLLELARRLQDQPVVAIPLYERLAVRNVKLGNNRAYREGIELLKELSGILKVEAHHQAYSSLLNDLRREFKAKRNFIKWLNEAFPD